MQPQSVQRCREGRVRSGFVLRHVLHIASGIVGAYFAIGCVSYEAAPIDLAARMHSVHSRAAAELGGGGSEDALRLSRDQAEVFALFFNAPLRVVRARAGIALATRETAGLWIDPVFGFDGAQVFNPGDLIEFGATLGVTLPISGRLALERERAQAGYDVELYRIASAEWSLRADVRAAWTQFSAAARQIALIDGLLEEIERISTIADRLESAGSIRSADARLLRIESAGRRADRVGALLARDRARIDLFGLLGLPAGADVELIPDLDVDLEASAVSIEQRVIASNPTLDVLRASYENAERALRLAVRQQYPDLTLRTGYGSEEDDDRLLLGMGIRLPLFRRAKPEIANAHARRELARAEAEAEVERLVRTAERLSISLAAARAQHARIENDVAPLLDDQSSNLEQLAALGDVDAFLALQTVGRRFDMQVSLLTLERDAALAEIELAEILGPVPTSDQHDDSLNDIAPAEQDVLLRAPR